MEEDPLSQHIPKISCDYCHLCLDGTDGWDSHFEANKQYAIKKCACGKRKWLNVGLEGFDPRDYFEKKGCEVHSNHSWVFEKE